MERFIGVLLLVFVLLIVHRSSSLRRRSTHRDNPACQPPRRYPHLDPILGLDFLFQTTRLIRQHKNVPAVAARHDDHGDTFVLISLGQQVFHTIEPENLEAFYSNQWMDWGVEPARLKAMEPFCGHGFITTDGETWQRFREMLRPSFADSNFENLAPFDAAVDEFLTELPADGTTVDMSLRLYELVGSRFPVQPDEYSFTDIYTVSRYCRTISVRSKIQ